MTTLVQQQSVQSYDYPSDSYSSSVNVDKVVQSVTNATKRLSQISTNTNNSSKKRKTQNKIGPWKLGRTLGRGSTGRVRLAKNIVTGKLAAVKIVPKSNFKMLENPKYKHPPTAANKDRLPYGIEREIIIMKLISHPNIMGLYDVWENKNDLYLILEYIEGGELFDYLIKRGRLQEFEAINYFKQIINGINYLHQFNICHRDLKPENLLLDFNKNIKIADFGMAALEVREKLLETSCGSPHYASPEIVAGRNYHGAPSDIWSCGIILFALLTGHLPFDDENIRKLLLKVQSGKFVMPDDLSWEAKDLITKMLKVEPSDRITIDLILTHPLLTKYPEPAASTSSNSNSLDFQNSNVKPIDSIDKIDKEILKNLSVLFHNCEEQEIISKLLSPNKCPEKMFYYLLMKYRNEHTACNSFEDEKNHYNEDFNDSRPSLPRSASIVKTTVYDQATGEKYTTIKKVPKSTSTFSNRSTKRNASNSKSPSNSNFKVLSNITNTVSPNASVRNFKASTSFNRKKTLLNTQAISRNNSASTLKKKYQNEYFADSSRSSIISKEKDDTSKPPKQYPPKLTRKLTGLLDLNELEKITDKSSTNPQETRTLPSKSSINAAARKKNMTGTFGNKSLLNFGLIIDEMFNEDDVKTPSGSLEPARNSSKSHNLANKERELAAKVKALNEAREDKYKEQELKRQKLLAQEQEQKLREQKELEEERKRQSILLQEKQKEALEKLRKHQSSNDFAEHFSSKPRASRFVTDPVHSSLDPKHTFNVNSLLRAKSLASTTKYAPQRFGNDNTSKVLHNLGIEVIQSPRKLSNNLKTSSSKNLSGYLQANSTAQSSVRDYSDLEEEPLEPQSVLDYDDDDDKENEMTLASFNQREREKSKGSILGTNTSTNTDQSNSTNKKLDSPIMPYRSLLGDIDEKERVKEFDETNMTNMSFETIPKNELIPNPRFSRFSFGGLLSNNQTNEIGDITIMNNTLNYSNTVIRKPRNSIVAEKNAAKSLLKKSSTTNLLGLGIREEKDEPISKSQSKSSRFVSVEIQESGDEFNATLPAEAISIRETDVEDEGHGFDDDNESEETMLDDTVITHRDNKSLNPNMLEEDYSNFDLISSRTADIGKFNTMRPSIVESKETLTIPRSEENTLRLSSHNESLKSAYNNYESLYGERRKSKNLIEVNKPNLAPDQHYYHHLNTKLHAVQRELVISEREKPQESITIRETPKSLYGLRRSKREKTKDEHNVSKNFEILDTSSFVDHNNDSGDERKPSRSSMEIFSSRALSKVHKSGNNDQETPNQNTEAINERKEVKVEQPVIESPILPPSAPSEDKTASLFRKLSLKPKRDAPKAPQPAKRFSKLSVGGKSPKVEMNDSPFPKKENWFKKFISAFTSSPGTKDKSKFDSEAVTGSATNSKSINIIDSSLASSELIRVIKTQLELKMIDGSISSVDIDEEFGLITGVIPSKFAHGRKLKFRIEIIDLINSSSLHLIKVKGNEKGFKNLINIVTFIIKQEEQASNQRRSSGYKFSGYKN
ncbi:Pkinase-domain-containing protein [Suhomyces tanzawaensis NRRL Y-17324]|uniref:non-specific serine/threonine protein kinase n=1 Tax=Suhomyces tanzawaensis NRRL Y-17324 TaxID=984487 RepID=A0A1E4SGN8_9ASCO|nr:Pkinase-domain-containing protein [Suhomyces tanzawaensis NRRL Y-17324]ODV78646.1 Pkinase-domain-containing protein [Suhomyces tanzawaensis NRRL Y-17324]